MAHHPTFSSRVRNQKMHHLLAHSVPLTNTIHSKLTELPGTGAKGLPHDSAFLAERGCLWASKHPAHSGPAHLH